MRFLARVLLLSLPPVSLESLRVQHRNILNNNMEKTSPQQPLAPGPEVTPVTTERVDNFAETNKGFNSSSENVNQVPSNDISRDGVAAADEPKKPWWKIFLEPGSAPQIVTAAIFAIALGLGIKEAVGDVPQAAITIVGIPGVLWLRALKAVGQLSSEMVISLSS